jgi:hypothetical protein
MQNVYIKISAQKFGPPHETCRVGETVTPTEDEGDIHHEYFTQLTHLSRRVYSFENLYLCPELVTALQNMSLLRSLSALLSCYCARFG